MRERENPGMRMKKLCIEIQEEMLNALKVDAIERQMTLKQLITSLLLSHLAIQRSMKDGD